MSCAGSTTVPLMISRLICSMTSQTLTFIAALTRLTSSSQKALIRMLRGPSDHDPIVGALRGMADVFHAQQDSAAGADLPIGRRAGTSLGLRWPNTLNDRVWMNPFVPWIGCGLQSPATGGTQGCSLNRVAVRR